MNLETKANQLVLAGNDLYRSGCCSEAEFCFSKAIYFFDLAGVSRSPLKLEAEDHLFRVYTALGLPDDALRYGC